MSYPTVDLSQVCEIVMGQAPKGHTYNQDGTGLPLIAGAGDFAGLHPAPTKFTTAKSIRRCESGDIVLGIRASIGMKVLADGEYCLGRGVAGLRAGPEVAPRYLWHWTTAAAPELAAKGRGATFLQVNKRDIAEMQIPLPPLAEQRRIAAVLDAADELRAKRRESVGKLDTLTQAIFIDMFGDPALGGTPLVPLVEAVSAPITRGIDQPGPDAEDGVPYLKTTDFRGPSPRRSALARSSPDIAAKFPRSVVTTGDTVICIRATVGPTMYITDELDRVNLSRGTARVSPSSEVLPKFLFTALNSVHFQRQIREKLRGATFLQIPLKELKQLRVPLPSMADQQRLVEAVEAVEAQVASSQLSRASLDSLFGSLQQRAFRGDL